MIVLIFFTCREGIGLRLVERQARLGFLEHVVVHLCGCSYHIERHAERVKASGSLRSSQGTDSSRFGSQPYEPCLVLVRPGAYDLGTSTLSMDTDHVDLVGLSTAREAQ